MTIINKKKVHFMEDNLEEDLDKKNIDNCNEVIKNYRRDYFDNFNKKRTIFMQSKIILNLYERISKLKLLLANTKK